MESLTAAAPAISLERFLPKLKEYFFSERTLFVFQRQPRFDAFGHRSHQIYFVNEFTQQHEGSALSLSQFSRTFECDAASVRAPLKMDWTVDKAAVVILPFTMLQKSKFSNGSKIKQRNSIQSHGPTFSITVQLNMLPLFREGE
jgi:hypothetical protein